MKITIITATYNSAAHIANCIESVNSQTYPNIEHIIIDGVSKDNTLEIINTTPNRVSKIVSEPDKGIYDAMNKGIRLATGDIIGTLNSDDTFYSPEALEQVAHTFEQHPEIDCLYGNLVFVNNEGKAVRRWQSRPFEPGLFAKSWSPGHPTFYCRREVFEKFGLYKTNYKIAADVEFMLRVMEVHCIKSYYLNKTLVRMSMGGVSTSGLQSTVTITREMHRAFKENGLPFNLPKYMFYKALKLREFF
ncbi:MAG TPA: glycosyltransferase [Mariniphaga anaerophila]|uniref:Glycosyltransferase n=1 Tax=Mariniphaga anaerophila TaxID=1484053 RepID=A0A831PR51_9BACT|nr:glycosyltransferase [Mariniphaga anaerophila]